MRATQEKDMLAEISRLTDAVQQLTAHTVEQGNIITWMSYAIDDLLKLVQQGSVTREDIMAAIKEGSRREVLVPISFSGNYTKSE